LRKPPKKDVAAIWRDWKGRDVYLLKQTLREHVTSFHFEESFLLEQLKRIFHEPLYVCWNPGAETENAVYDLPCSGKRWMVVAIRKRQQLSFKSFWIVSTIYAVNEERLPKQHWKLLHGTREEEKP
jgi:hypothetical protein